MFYLKGASIKVLHKISLNVNITILKANKMIHGPKWPPKSNIGLFIVFDV